MSKLKKLFGTKLPIIGALHFSPLVGFEGFVSLSKILKTALIDLKAFEEGGVDGIIVENNYDLPHKIIVGPETVAAMTYLTKEIVERTKLPVGVSVLWNDYEAALSISKVCGAKFVRVPVFVDSVETSFGKILARPKEVIAYRKKIEAEDILLFTDVQVKHAKMLTEQTLSKSIKEAIEEESDTVIITGNWTGDAPNTNELRKAKEASGKFPLIIGSGADISNINSLLKYVDGVIVSTSLKEGAGTNKERNIKSYSQRIDINKVRSLVRITKDETN